MSECLQVAYSCQQSKKKYAFYKSGMNLPWPDLYFFGWKKPEQELTFFVILLLTYIHYVPQFINKILHFQAKKKLYKNDPKLPDKNSYSATHIQHCLDPIVFRSNLKGDFLVFLPPRDHLSSSHYLQIFFHENSKTYFFKVRGGPRVS